MGFLTTVLRGVALLPIGLQFSAARYIDRNAAVSHRDTIDGLVQGNTTIQPSSHRNTTDEHVQLGMVSPGIKITGPERSKLINEGCNLLWAMRWPDSEASYWVNQATTAESPWKNFGDLDAWGYDVDDEAMGAYYEDDDSPDLDAALRANNIGTEKSSEDGQGGPNVLTAWEHARETKHGEVKYRPTTAQFQNIMNVDDGVIVSWYNFGPKIRAPRQDPPVTTLPQLKNWSDIVFLSWKHTAGLRKKDGKTLRYIIATGIVNPTTLDLLGEALVSKGLEKPAAEGKDTSFFPEEDCHKYPWNKRVEFAIAEDVAKALLASPNGHGNARLLIQHKSTFGQRSRITGITFWCSKIDGPVDEESDREGEPDANLMFHVSQRASE